MSRDIWSFTWLRESAAPWLRSAFLCMDDLIYTHIVPPVLGVTLHILLCLNYNPLQTFIEENEKKMKKKKSVRDLFPDRALTKLSQLSVLRWHTTAVLLLVPHNESVTSSKMLPAGNWNSKFTFANPGLDGCTKITVFVNTKSTTYTEIIDKWSKEAKAL